MSGEAYTALAGSGRAPPLPGAAWRTEQTEDLKRVLGRVDREIPLVLVSGNHDVGNAPTPETIAEFQRTWGDDYFSFWAGGVLFLVLNSQLLCDASRCPGLKQAQDRWLEQQLGQAARRQCRHAVVFQHIPLFLQSIDEDDDYFNLTRTVRKEMADKFIKAGSVRGGRVVGSFSCRSARPRGDRVGLRVAPGSGPSSACHSLAQWALDEQRSPSGPQHPHL